MSIPEPDYVTLAQVAARTGRHPELLRQWCAAGRLPCRRVGGSWVLREADIALVDGMARRGRTPTAGRRHVPDGTRVIAAAFIDPLAGEQAAVDLRAALPVDPDEIGVAPVALPGVPPLSITVVAARLDVPLAREARSLLVSRGGRIVADVSGEPVVAAAPPNAPIEVGAESRHGL